ncbi:MAG: pectin acetylesterase-family hydrolase [Terricaulis sp.]
MKTWHSLAALALAACSAHAGEDEIVAPPPAWVEVNPDPVRIDGVLFTPTCSGAPETDPAYRFWYRQGSGDGLVVFFDGGGACWDDVTCAVPRRARDRNDDGGLYKAELLPGDNPSAMQGIFDLANPRNPVRDWSFVFVPYCTGDVHVGAAAAHYSDPDTGALYTIQHRGGDNFRAILHWMGAHVSQPRILLVTGSSAGAYGAAAHYPAIRETYPDGDAIMLADAGQGVSAPGSAALRNRAWNYQPSPAIFGGEGDDAIARLAAHFPRDRFAQYTTSADVTQRAYYALTGGERTCSAWTDAMAAALEQRQQIPNFRSYLAAGETHIILRRRLLYTERSGGAVFADWFAALLGPALPENRACTDCLAPPTQCAF